MISSLEEYLKHLRNELKEHAQVEEICLEYELHISDMLEDIYIKRGCPETEAMKFVSERLGTPKDIAEMFQKVTSMTANKTKWIFFFANMFFFVGGISLTIFYHQLSIPTISKLWTFLTSIPFVLIMLYLAFWLLLGYEVGKEFGLGGQKVLTKTFLLSLVPNLLLMCLVVFRIVPVSIFAPLLTPEFILICIAFTVILYPICFLGFRFGTTRSV